jgi:hypothetical protein
MSIMDAQIIRNLIDEFGATVIVQEVDKSSSNKYGDMTEVVTNKLGLKAFVQIITAADEEVREGIFKSGDVIFHFKPNDKTYMQNGNRIIWNNNVYEINDTIEHVVGDETLLMEARVRKYSSKHTYTKTLSSRSKIS